MCECFRSDLSVIVLVDIEEAFISVVEVGGGEGEVRSTAESAPPITFWVDPIDGSGLKRCTIQCKILMILITPRV
jgi:predicted ATP-dependent Lon-type protease